MKVDFFHSLHQMWGKLLQQQLLEGVTRAANISLKRICVLVRHHLGWRKQILVGQIIVNMKQFDQNVNL